MKKRYHVVILIVIGIFMCALVVFWFFSNVEILEKPPAKNQLASTVIDKKDISESEIKIIEEEFDVSLPEPIEIEGVIYLSMPQGAPIISIQLSGIAKSDFIEKHVP
jgi:hypothetical protein